MLLVPFLALSTRVADQSVRMTYRRDIALGSGPARARPRRFLRRSGAPSRSLGPGGFLRRRRPLGRAPQARAGAGLPRERPRRRRRPALALECPADGT